MEPPRDEAKGRPKMSGVRCLIGTFRWLTGDGETGTFIWLTGDGETGTFR